jgi:hypothetical protein
MALTIVRESVDERAGIYVGGFTIAPNGLLIVADNYSEAWEVMVDHYADMGALAECEHESGEDADLCDCHDYGSSGGPYVTLDLALRVVRNGRGE